MEVLGRQSPGTEIAAQIMAKARRTTEPDIAGLPFRNDPRDPFHGQRGVPALEHVQRDLRRLRVASQAADDLVVCPSGTVEQVDDLAIWLPPEFSATLPPSVQAICDDGSGA